MNAGWPAYEEALKKAGVQYTAHHDPSTNHGFHNDTTPRQDEAAAKLPWQRTLEGSLLPRCPLARRWSPSITL